MPPLTRRLDFALTWLIAIAAIVFGLAMVYSSLLSPLASGSTVQLDQAAFAVGVLFAACTLAYYCKVRTSAAKWATYFMALLSIWAHALVYLAMRLFGGGAIEVGEYLRMGAGALVLAMFGTLWAKAYRAHHFKASP